MSIKETLEQREKQHGNFPDHCELEYKLRHMLHEHGGELNQVQYIGLGMVLHKIARILNNGHMHTDSWHDIAGYATLVEQYMSRFEAELKDQADFDCGNKVG